MMTTYTTCEHIWAVSSYRSGTIHFTDQKRASKFYSSVKDSRKKMEQVTLLKDNDGKYYFFPELIEVNSISDEIHQNNR